MLSFILLFLTTLLLSGCTDKEDELTLAVGGAPAEVEKWSEIIKEFENKEGIRVKLIRQPADTDLRRQNLVLALRSKKKDPDVFLMDIAWVSQFIESGWLTELDGVDTTPFFGSAVAVDKKGEKIFAVPLYVDCGLLYYRKDLLKEYNCGLPSTWKQLVECALRVQQGERGKGRDDFYGFVWQGAQYEGLICNFLEFASGIGGGFQKLNSPENLRALNFMKDIIHRFPISPPNTYTEMKEEEARIFFQMGKALFERNWPYAWKLHNSESSHVKGKVGVTLLPKFRDGDHASCLGGWHLGISFYSDKKGEALKLVRYLTSKEVQIELARKLGWNPARKDVYDELIKEQPHMKVVLRSCEKAVPRPSVPYYSQMSEVLRKYLNAVLANRMSPDKALELAQRELERLIEMYR